MLAQTSYRRPDVQWQLPGTMYGSTDRRELVISPSGQLLAYYHTHDAGFGLRGYISVWKPTGDATFSLVTTMQPSFGLNYSYFTSYSGPRLAFTDENHLVAADGSAPGNGVDYFSIDPTAPDGEKYRRLATYRNDTVTHNAVAAVDTTRFVTAATKQGSAVTRLYQYNPTTKEIDLLDEKVLCVGEATCIDVAKVENNIYAVVGTDSGSIFMFLITDTSLINSGSATAPAHVTRIDAYTQGGLRYVAGTIHGQIYNGTVVYTELRQDPVYDIDVLPSGHCWVSFGSRSVRLRLHDLAYEGAMEYPAFQRYYPSDCLLRTTANAPLSFAVDSNSPSNATAVYTVPVASVPNITRLNLPTQRWEVSLPLSDGTAHGANAIDSVYFETPSGPRWHFLAVTNSTGQGITVARVINTDLSHGSDYFPNILAGTAKDVAYLKPVIGGNTYAFFALHDGKFAILENEFTSKGYLDVGGDVHTIAVTRYHDQIRVAVGRSFNPDRPQVLIYSGDRPAASAFTLAHTIDLPTTFGYGMTVRDVEFNPSNPDELCIYATYRGSYNVLYGWVGIYDLDRDQFISYKVVGTVGTPRANSIAYSPYGDKIALPNSFDVTLNQATLYSVPNLELITYPLMRPLFPDLSFVVQPKANSVTFLNADLLVVAMVGHSDNIVTPAHGHLVGVIQLQEGGISYWRSIKSQHTASVTGISSVNGLTASVADDGKMHIYNFYSDGSVVYEYNPPNFKGTLDLEPNTLEVAGGGHYTKGRGVRNNATPFAPIQNLTDACAAHTAWISGGFDAGGRLWHITPEAIEVINGLGTVLQSQTWSPPLYQPAVHQYVNIATEGNQAVICVPTVLYEPSLYEPSNRLTFAEYNGSLIALQNIAAPDSYYRNRLHVGDPVFISEDGKYALFVGYRQQSGSSGIVYKPLLALFHKQSGTWSLSTEKVFVESTPFYSGALLPRSENQQPLVLATNHDGSAYLYDPDNNWSIVQTILNIQPISVDYRDGFVVFGGHTTLNVFAYDSGNTQPLSARRVYNLEAWPGVTSLKLGHWDQQNQRIPTVYTRANGDLTFAYLLTTPEVSCGCEDINSDGIVDDGDLLLVLFGFGLTGPDLYSQGDVNCDEVVDDADLLLVLFAFGGPCD